MSDPYNSYGASVPPAKPVPASAVAEVAQRPKIDPIAKLDVSESWKKKFRLIERAGGPDLPEFRDLAFGERFGLTFNFLALLFGPIYFLIKGLWRQAILYVVLAIALGVVLELAGFERLSRAIGYGIAAAFAFRANISYYKKVVLGESPWL